MFLRRTLDKQQIAAAIDAAEASSGHQIMVHIGNLGRDSAKRADAIAVQNPGVSLLLCLDIARHKYEVRWAAGIGLDTNQVHSHLATHLTNSDIVSAITELARLLPRQAEGNELPDVVDETD